VGDNSELRASFTGNVRLPILFEQTSSCRCSLPSRVYGWFRETGLKRLMSCQPIFIAIIGIAIAMPGTRLGETVTVSSLCHTRVPILSVCNNWEIGRVRHGLGYMYGLACTLSLLHERNVFNL
jgi:hypothetical protein